ncbi:unnamed protein product [Urochloa decumbens]|uniref:RING-type domain-containing protein n=1 Tax=Urochloa decumbens TaxID=240449 RepID=A0ABC8VIC0_9POAL
MAPPPAPLAAPDADAPSLKSALLIIGGLLLFVVAAIVLFRYLRRRCSASSGPRRASSEAEGGAAGREDAEAGEAARTAAAAGREEVEAVRIAAAVGRAEARPATERVEVEGERRDAGAAAADGDEDTELLIASLPLFTMASALAALPKNSPDCAVCLSPFEAGDWLRLLPACRHAFHAVCIDAWLRTSPVCPICRAAVSSPLPPLPSAPAAAAAGASAGQEPLGGDSRRASRRSFRVELGSLSNRRLSSCSAAAGGDDGSWRRTYSLGGSFDYRVDEEVEAIISRIVRPAAATSRTRPSAPAEPDEVLAEAVGSHSRGWLSEYLDRVAASASSLSGRWSGRLSQGCRSHSRRHDESWRWDPEAAAAAAAKSATSLGEEAPAEARGMGEFRSRDNLASSASTLSGRWSWRWSLGHHGDRRGESWRWDPEAACGAPREEEREPALVALGRWILGF